MKQKCVTTRNERRIFRNKFQSCTSYLKNQRLKQLNTLTQLKNITDVERLKAIDLENWKTRDKEEEVDIIQQEMEFRTLEMELMNPRKKYLTGEKAPREELEVFDVHKDKSIDLREKLKLQRKKWETIKLFRQKAENAWKNAKGQLDVANVLMSNTNKTTEAAEKKLAYYSAELEKRSFSLKGLEQQLDEVYEQKINVEKYRLIIQFCRSWSQLDNKRKKVVQNFPFGHFNLNRPIKQEVCETSPSCKRARYTQ